MGTNQSWSAIGEEVRGAIEDALKTGDFKNFNELVGDVASEVVKAAKEQISQGIESQSARTGYSGGNAAGQNYTEKWLAEHRERRAAHQTQAAQTFPARATLAPFERKGSVSGTLFQVFGGIGTGIMAFMTASFLIVALWIDGGAWAPTVVFAALLLVALGIVKAGNGKKSRLKRALNYLRLAGNNHYINIEDLALHTSQNEKAVRKDVKKLLAEGFYPEGHLDRQESCLMLDNKIYDEYLMLEKQRKEQEQEMRAIPERGAAPSASVAVSPQVEKLIAEGQDYIRKLRDKNDNIPGESISAKLFRLENLLKEIFDRLKEHPEQAPQMEKFMNYYLPTTLKLVTAYEEFDSLSEQGQDILEAKAEIEKTLDTINSAFSELLNRLFRDAAFDVTTDAQVLQTMLAKEGLTREPELVRR